MTHGRNVSYLLPPPPPFFFLFFFATGQGELVSRLDVMPKFDSLLQRAVKAQRCLLSEFVCWGRDCLRAETLLKTESKRERRRCKCLGWCCSGVIITVLDVHNQHSKMLFVMNFTLSPFPLSWTAVRRIHSGRLHIQSYTRDGTWCCSSTYYHTTFTFIFC